MTMLRSHRLSTRSRLHRFRSASAFTLSEVLVAAALGLAVLAAAGTVVIAHIRTTTRQATILRFQDDWGRLSHLIETEVSEGDVITYGGSDDVGCGTPSAGERLFTIQVPISEDVDGDGNPEIVNEFIAYNQKGTDITRCGPRFAVDGTLVFNAAAETEATLLSNATFNIDPAAVGNDCGAPISNVRLIRYNLTIQTASTPNISSRLNNPVSAVFPGPGQCTQARVKADYIDE